MRGYTKEHTDANSLQSCAATVVDCDDKSAAILSLVVLRELTEPAIRTGSAGKTMAPVLPYGVRVRSHDRRKLAVEQQTEGGSKREGT